MANEKTGDIEIGGRLFNTATGNIVAGADAIQDDNQGGKTQQQINVETYEHVANVDAALDELNPDQSEAIALAGDVVNLKKYAVRGDVEQSLTDAQKAQALANVGISGIDDEPTDSDNLVKSRGVLINAIKSDTLLPFSKLTIFKGWLAADGHFQNNGFYKVIAVNGASILKIRRGSDNFYIAIVKSYHGYRTGDTITDFATGETGTRYINGAYKQNPLTVQLPSDAQYIIVGESVDGTTLRTPSLLMLDSYDVLKGIVEYSKQANNEILKSLDIINSMKIDNCIGKNLWNSQNILINKYYNSNGGISNGPSGETNIRCIEDYIPLLPETSYCLSNSDNQSVGYLSLYFCFYDSQKQFISSISSNNKTFTTPTNCAYGRFSFLESANKQVQLEIGTARTAYAPYSPIGGYYAEKIPEIDSPNILPNAVTTPKIADGAVTPKQTNFFVPSKNLFDWTTMLVAGKYLNSLGKELPNENYYCSSFIPISKKSGNDIVSTMYGTVGANNAFYDDNKNFISNFQTKTAEIPQNAKYVRLSFKTTDMDVLKAIQVEYGTESTSFVPFCYKIDEQYIPQQEEVASNEIIVPKYLYLLSGVNNDVFYEPILRKWNPYQYDIFANTTPNGRDYVKAIKRVVTLNNPTATGLSLSLYDLEKEDFIQTKTITLRKGTQGAGSAEIKVGIIGDSYTDGGCFTSALLSHGYVPNLKLVGTRQVTNYITQCTDGRSGWTLNTFFNVQTNVDYFNPFLHPQGSHRYWGNTAFWAGVCGGSPSGYQARYTQYASLCDANGWPVSPLEGDVIYDSTNSSFKEYQSGSWVTIQQSDYSWEFNYSKYLSMWSIETPDILCVMLGVNDFWVNNYPSEANLLIWKERMNTMIFSYKSSNPTGKFVILTANTVTHHNVLHYRPLDVHNRMQILREFVINEWDNKEADGIYVVDTAQLVDSENAFVLTESTPFDGFSGTTKEVYANDGQHPRLNYTTLGYSLAAFIQYIR